MDAYIHIYGFVSTHWLVVLGEEGTDPSNVTVRKLYMLCDVSVCMFCTHIHVPPPLSHTHKTTTPMTGAPAGGGVGGGGQAGRAGGVVVRGFEGGGE